MIQSAASHLLLGWLFSLLHVPRLDVLTQGEGRVRNSGYQAGKHVQKEQFRIKSLFAWSAEYLCEALSFLVQDATEPFGQSLRGLKQFCQSAVVFGRRHDAEYATP